MSFKALNKRICFFIILIVSLVSFIPLLKNLSVEDNGNSSRFMQDGFGWITSPLLYEEMLSYLQSIRHNHQYQQQKQQMKLKTDYIEIFNTTDSPQYPYSNRTCSNTTNQESSTGTVYCLFHNIYYNSNSDEYYYFQDSSKIDIVSTFIELDVSYGKLKLNIINDIFIIVQLSIKFILTQPMYIGGPVDPNYAHGFLETWGPRFWVLSEIQHHTSYVDPQKIQIYYTSHMFKSSKRNWELYERLPDGTYRDKARWSQILQAMFSKYPLLTYKSFDGRNVLFKYFIITGNQVSRTPAWDYYYSISRSFRSHPFHTQQYRRIYLAYSEWLLNNLNVSSKFSLTSIQQKLQTMQQREIIPICDTHCISTSENAQGEYTGDWIVVLNRKGNGRRELLNADELVEALLKTFPDKNNPYLRVWPKQFDFNDNLYETARIARSTRLLIGVHGAGLANIIFMRPGTVLYEINPLGCRKLSFNFHRWATIFNLQHALWSPSQRDAVFQDDACQNRQASTSVIVSEIIREVVNLIQNEAEYRNGYLRRALLLLNDTSLNDYPNFRL